MRLIDADRLLNHAIAFFTGCHTSILQFSYVSDMIINAPTVDAVPVVRCKECKCSIVNAPTVDAVPLSELTALRDTLYDMDAITFRGLGKLNQLISKYGGQDSSIIPDERRWLETV